MRDVVFRVESPDGAFICLEWLAGDGWKNDYFNPLVENGVVCDEEVNVELIRKQYTGQVDCNGVLIFDGMAVNIGTTPGKSKVIWRKETASWVIESEFITDKYGYISLSEDVIKMHNVSVIENAANDQRIHAISNPGAQEADGSHKD